MERQIPLHGAKNIRDFGGIVNKDGKTIKYGCFIRSCALNKLTKTDRKKLAETYHLSTIIDLRTPVEKVKKPDKEIPHTKTFFIPLFSDAVTGISHEKKASDLAMLNNLPDHTELYRVVVRSEECVSQLKKVFDVILHHNSGALLWHCTEGKDRCGITSVLFLSLLDVDLDTIYKDYLMTNEVPSKRGKRCYFAVRYLLRDKVKAEKVKRLFSAKKEYLNSALDEITCLYGSVDNFLREKLGITDEMKKEFQAKYLE